MVSRLMDGLKGTSSKAGNVGGAAAFFTSTAAGVFGSGWLSVTVTASGTGSGSGSGSDFSSGFGSGRGCALSGGKQTERLFRSQYTNQGEVHVY